MHSQYLFVHAVTFAYVDVETSSLIHRRPRNVYVKVTAEQTSRCSWHWLRCELSSMSSASMSVHLWLYMCMSRYAGGYSCAEELQSVPLGARRVLDCYRCICNTCSVCYFFQCSLYGTLPSYWLACMLPHALHVLPKLSLMKVLFIWFCLCILSI